ncbi:MAG: hypothetical protein EXR72_00330 [Myxococcales bacterium]|nr:hypothetical protein [Myxococcales bacterium]
MEPAPVRELRDGGVGLDAGDRALPVFGFMVLPAAAALLVGRRLWQVFTLSVAFAISSAVLGYYASFRWSLPTGASMVVVAALFLVPGLCRLAWVRR